MNNFKLFFIPPPSPPSPHTQLVISYSHANTTEITLQLRPKVAKQLLVPNNERGHTIQINNDRRVYILPIGQLQYILAIGYLHCMMSFFVRHYNPLPKQERLKNL